MARISAISLSCLAAAVIAPQALHASTANASSRTQYGLKVTLHADGHVHLRDSLVLMSVTVRNVSHRKIALCGDCVDGAIEIEVMDHTGRLLYPPAVPMLAEAVGGKHPQRVGSVLLAGGVLRLDQYVILRGRYVRAVVRLIYGNRVVKVTVAPLTFVTQPGPQLTLVTTPVVLVQVANAALGKSLLLYSFSYRCQQDNGVVEGGYDWRINYSTTIQPEIDSSCGKLIEFHMVAGRLGEPIGRVDYNAP